MIVQQRTALSPLCSTPPALVQICRHTRWHAVAINEIRFDKFHANIRLTSQVGFTQCVATADAGNLSASKLSLAVRVLSFPDLRTPWPGMEDCAVQCCAQVM